MKIQKLLFVVTIFVALHGSYGFGNECTPATKSKFNNLINSLGQLELISSRIAARKATNMPEVPMDSQLINEAKSSLSQACVQVLNSIKEDCIISAPSGREVEVERKAIETTCEDKTQ